MVWGPQWLDPVSLPWEVPRRVGVWLLLLHGSLPVQGSWWDRGGKIILVLRSVISQRVVVIIILIVNYLYTSSFRSKSRI